MKNKSHFLFLSQPRDFFFFFLYKRENLTKWKHKQLIMWNLTLISISLYFFSVSFSLPHCEKLPSLINWKLELIILLSSLGEKSHGQRPRSTPRARCWAGRRQGRTVAPARRGPHRAVRASSSSGIMTRGQHRPRIHQEHSGETRDTDRRRRKRKRHRGRCF